jgi:hypothetical protein
MTTVRVVAVAVTALVSVGLVPAAGAGGKDQWAALRRPLHLPQLAPGAKCPVSKVDRSVAWSPINIFGDSGIGSGPAYPGLGGSSGLIYMSRDQQYGGPWFGTKVFWYVRSIYRGPLLIRGRRLDGTGRLGFNGTKSAGSELRIAAGQTVSWQGQPRGSRGVPSGVRARTAGCYGIQIDGTTFSRVVVVTVDLAT